MRKRVILTLMEGSLEQGFPAILRISQDAASAQMGIQISGKLPAAPNILEHFKSWQLAYHQLVISDSRIKTKSAQVKNISYRQLGSNFLDCLNDWLNSGSREWQKIRDGLQRNLNDTDEIEVIIQTNDSLLRQFPWHLWDFFEYYSLAEVSLSTSEYKILKRSFRQKSNAKVNILAILGNSQGIDIAKDRSFLEQLSEQAELEFLVEPKLEELNDKLWEKGWDILFFAGHSSSEEKGEILLNQTDTITLAQLRYALKQAIGSGLRLAIFNSCDGLGLAKELEDLHIGQVIVMREPVPDVVAQAFLSYFLTAFSSGKSLYASVREARERLQRLESQYPYATWLPVICQNPAEVSPTWQDLRGLFNRDFIPNLANTNSPSNLVNNNDQEAISHPQLDVNQQEEDNRPSSKKRFRFVLVATGIVTAMILGLRYLGMLQALELKAFDQLMRLRPDEPQDSRLLVVTITENDFHLPEQKSRKGSLSDLALAQLLEKLAQFKPRAIGLDIYRDDPIEPNYKDLATRLKNDDSFFVVCKVSEANHPGISPPPDVPIERLGFSDVVTDSDGILRRHLLAMKPAPSSPCTASYALSAQLAFYYLEAEGISAKYAPTGDLQIGQVVFKRLFPHMGGYQKVDAWGYQILLNYRSYRSPLEIAPTVTLADVLNGKVKPDQVKDRIVLIGVTAPSAHDYLPTPYSPQQGFYQEMPGVIIHAQMVSQILSAVKDGRPLLSVWPFWGESLWIWGWSVVGGILVWRCRKGSHRVVWGVVALGSLCGLCFGLFRQSSCWIPLVPSALALVFTGGTVVLYTASQEKRQQHTSINLEYE
ncbi:MAG TPA: sensor protein Chase2 [Cyanobacteria bacterium UBA11370]|nr:sensor protein Chase2 [Cyanobacteria bacterium UBA11370]